MRTEWSTVKEGDITGAACLLDDKDNPIVDFELHKDYYVADWETDIKQGEFFQSLKKISYPIDAPAIIQSKAKYQQKAEIRLEDAVVLGDEISFLAFDSDEYGMTWYLRKDGKKVIEFSSKTRNLPTLKTLLNQTSYGIGDKIGDELEKILNKYKE